MYACVARELVGVYGAQSRGPHGAVGGGGMRGDWAGAHDGSAVERCVPIEWLQRNLLVDRDPADDVVQALDLTVHLLGHARIHVSDLLLREALLIRLLVMLVLHEVLLCRVEFAALQRGRGGDGENDGREGGA